MGTVETSRSCVDSSSIHTQAFDIKKLFSSHPLWSALRYLVPWKILAWYSQLLLDAGGWAEGVTRFNVLKHLVVGQALEKCTLF